MTPRQRVLDALNHVEPDRVPIDLSGHRSSGISAIAYPKLKKALGIDSGDTYVYDMVQQLAIVEPPVLDALEVDVIEMGRGFLLDELEWKPWVLPDGTPCKVPGYLNLEQRGEDWWLLTDQGHELGVQKAGCLYFEQARFPLMERGIEGDDFADLAEYLGQTIWAGVPHPGAHLPLDAVGLAEMARRAEALRASTDRAIVGLFGGNFFEMPQWLYRMDNYLMYLAACPDDVIRLSQALCAIYLSNLEKWLGAVGPYIDIILFGDDLGGQNGPFLSADMYRRYYKPYHRRLTRRAKELANVKTMLHCCGSIKPLLGDLVEAGFDAINPVQISCADMESGSLKREFGHAMTFWGGGCDTHRVLPTGTPQDVVDHVKRQVQTFAAGGGFVFQQVHNIQADVPIENVLAMFQAVRER